MGSGRKVIFLLCIGLVAVGIAGCTVQASAGEGSIDFQQIFEQRRDERMKITNTVEMDTDGDAENEWIVFYRYDPTRRGEWENTPIQATVYDAAPCDPPAIYHWSLPFPDNDYLGEGEEVEVYMSDWLTSSAPGAAPQELVVEGPGPANTLSIFRYRDDLQNPCAPHDEQKQRYDLLGFFRSGGRIVWDEETKTVTTYQRSTFERSQLAIRSTYAPRQGSAGETFLNENGSMIDPQEQSVDFLYGVPSSPLESPYPEKAVAAFYRTLGRDNEQAVSFLADELQPEFNMRFWGLDLKPADISRVLIYSVSYNPDREAELARQDREVTMVVAAVDHNNQRYPPRRVTWRVVGYPIPNEQHCEWRLAEIKSVIVTEGLGSLPQPRERMEDIAFVP